MARFFGIVTVYSSYTLVLFVCFSCFVVTGCHGENIIDRISELFREALENEERF